MPIYAWLWRSNLLFEATMHIQLKPKALFPLQTKGPGILFFALTQGRSQLLFRIEASLEEVDEG